MTFVSKAFAQATSSGSSLSFKPPITTTQELLQFMCTIFSWMFYGLIVLSLIMIVVAAYNYATANGEAEKVSKANKMILYAAIAIAVALLAKGIPAIVASLLGAKATSGSFLAC
ncbi:MAG TPA: hypothetical protein VMT81_01030 [Candidatus Paceibacterota bacterium]|nr:hypothetical protein [Candidatus Paceibacterota bacterium]